MKSEKFTMCHKGNHGMYQHNHASNADSLKTSFYRQMIVFSVSSVVTAHCGVQLTNADNTQYWKRQRSLPGAKDFSPCCCMLVNTKY